MNVWKCFDGHVFQPLFASSAGVRRDLPSKETLYENLLLSVSRLPFHLAQVLYSLAEGLNLFPFSSCRAVFQATATTYPASSSNWMKNEWRKCVVQICNSVWSETNGTLCTLGVEMSAVSAEAPLLLQAARGTMLSFSSDSTCYMGNLNSKSNFLFSENKLLETIFFVAVFLFFTCHSISHEIKTVIWMTNIHCWVITTMTLHHLKKLYNNFQTSSFLHQRWQTMIVQIPNFIHVSRKKSFKLISCRLHSPDFLHSLFS